MTENANSNSFRNGLFFAIIVLIFIGGYFYLSQKKSAREFNVNLTDTQCQAPLTNRQLHKAQQVMAAVVHDLTGSNVCNARYLKGCISPKDISSNCLNIYEEILEYLKSNNVKFCKSGNSTIFAEVDIAIPDIIFLSDRFFLVGSDPERRRTLAHELTHLAGFVKKHTEEKNCTYFDDFALQVEHCLTCEATLIASNDFSSCTSSSGGSFTISPK